MLRKIRRFIAQLLGEFVHKKRQETIAAMAAGGIASKSFVPAEIGRGIPGDAFEKHRIKRVDRFLNNENIDMEPIARSIILLLASGDRRRYTDKNRKRLGVAIDWSDFGDFKVLTAAVVTTHRGMPFHFKVVDETETRLKVAEREFLEELKDICPSWIHFEILADRGFDDANFLKHVGEQCFSFVVRVCKDNSIRQDGEAAFKQLGDLPIERDRVYDLGEVDFTAAHRFRTRLVIVHDKNQKDAWFLSTNMLAPSGRAIVWRYGRRFEIEESFKDLKDMRAGLHIGHVNLEKPERLTRLLIVAVLAYLFLVSAGLYGEKHNLQRRFQANTRKQRVLAVWRLGLRILRRMSLAIKHFVSLLSEAPIVFEVQA